MKDYEQNSYIVVDVDLALIDQVRKAFKRVADANEDPCSNSKTSAAELLSAVSPIVFKKGGSFIRLTEERHDALDRRHNLHHDISLGIPSGEQNKESNRHTCLK